MPIGQKTAKKSIAIIIFELIFPTKFPNFIQQSYNLIFIKTFGDIKVIAKNINDKNELSYP